MQVLEKELSTMERCLKIDTSGEKHAALAKMLLEGERDDATYRRRLIDTFVSKVYMYNDKYIVFYNVTGYTEDDEAKIKSLEQNECSKLFDDGRGDAI